MERIQTCGKMLAGSRQIKRVQHVRFCWRNRIIFPVLLVLAVLINVYIFLNSSANILTTQQDYQRNNQQINGKDTRTKGAGERFKHINPHDYKYIIPAQDTCKNVDVYLLIAVCVTDKMFDRRQTIRNTWGSVVSQNQTVRLIFILGISNSSTIQNKVQEESAQFGDIVQEDFIESYFNLTLKSVAILRWVSLFCRQTLYVFKVDSDVFVNVKLLLADLKLKNYKHSIIGIANMKTKPIKDKQSKFYTPPEAYNQSIYPDYASGGGYVISGDIVSELFKASLSIPFFQWEDVFVGGFCRLKINATLIDDPRYNCGFLHKACQYKSVFCGNILQDINMKSLWEDTKNSSLVCHK